MEDFLLESRAHGWPSFRGACHFKSASMTGIHSSHSLLDQEVNWDLVRVLPDGEAVSVDGTHLGHNLPDGKGSRYCINLVSVAGNPAV